MIPGIVASGRRASAPVTDPNCLSLLHFDGADGSTSMIDEVAGRVWTPSGNAQLDTALQVFGASSLLLDGVGDYISLDSPSLAIGNGDFTIETWVRWVARSGNHFVFSWGAGWGLYTFTSQWAIFNGIATNPIGPVGTVANNTWYHCAAVRQSGTLALYVAGARLGTAVDTTNHSTAFLRIGAQPSGAGATNGNIDEFRVSNIARYSGATYTVPTAPFVA